MINYNHLQESFLNQVRKSKTPVTIFLTNGFQIQGTITGFDNFMITINADNKQQALYKQVVSTIEPAEPLKLGKGE